MGTRRALLISPTYTLLDDPDIPSTEQVRRTPENTWSQGLGALLTRVATGMDGSGVLMLDQAAATALHLPTHLADVTRVTTGLDEARAAGWRVDKPGPWTTFHADGRPTVHVGVTSMVDARRCPLMSEWPQDTVSSLRLWHEWTGQAWHGTPGVAGMALLRALAPRTKVRGRLTTPTWKAPAGPEACREAEFTGKTWFRSMTTRYEHGYDASRMYLAAAQGCEVLAPWTLRNTGKVAFDPRLAGWWKVELHPWTIDDIPHPAGPGDELVRWITTPTAILLTELVEQGVYGGFEVIDSWTGEGRRLLRKWGECLEHTYQRATAAAQERDGDGYLTDRAHDAARVARATKEVYREAWGLLNRQTNSIFRPDWHHTILAHARCNLWRKVWKIGRTEDRWPVVIDNNDNVWYGSDNPDPVEACPAGLTLGDALGQFKPKGTREQRKAKSNV